MHRIKAAPLAIAVALIGSGCLIPLVAPGSRVETGPVANLGRDSSANGVQVKVGTHLASIAMSTAQNHDVGAGYIFEDYAKPTALDETDLSKRRSLHGGYFEYARRLASSQRDGRRLYFGVRGEVLAALGTRTNFGVGGAARFTYEFAKGGEADFTSQGKCSTTSGTTYGTTAVGFYAEAGYRALEGNAAVFTAGLTLRLPSLVGVAFVVPLPGC